MAVLESQSQDIEVLSGQTLDVQFDCFSDDALSVAFDLTGYTFTAVLTPPGPNPTPVTLTPGAGLTVNATAGTVEMRQDTTGWEVGRGRWYLQAVDSAGLKSYPLRGVLFVGNP